MRLLVLNGSPRGTESNTDVLLASFLSGFHEREGHAHELFHLVARAERPRALAVFGAADAVLLAFPLYVDAMPAPVSEFVELLAPLCGRDGNPRLLFLVQSGFPESCHSRPVERWARKLALRLGSPYVGTIVKGGVEGIKLMPPWMTRKLRERVRGLGRGFGATGRLDEELLRELARPERFGPLGRLAFAALSRVGLLNFNWNLELKKNGALAERDLRPYEPRPARAPSP